MEDFENRMKSNLFSLSLSLSQFHPCFLSIFLDFSLSINLSLSQARYFSLFEFYEFTLCIDLSLSLAISCS